MHRQGYVSITYLFTYTEGEVGYYGDSKEGFEDAIRNVVNEEIVNDIGEKTGFWANDIEISVVECD